MILHIAKEIWAMLKEKQKKYSCLEAWEKEKKRKIAHISK